MEIVKNILVETSQVKVGAVVAVTPAPVIVVRRRMSAQAIADDIASRITGRLIGWADLYDPKTNSFLTESELTAKGAVFATVSINKKLGDSDTVKKGRTTDNPTPFIRKTSRYQVIVNINWQSYINRRSEHGDFVAAEKRTNGIENYEDCKAIGVTKSGKYTINGVAFRVLEGTRYFDQNGQEYPDKAALEAEYCKVASQASKEKEALKHGIAVEFDPQYRTTRIDSCDSIRAFLFDYIPTEE
jgi:hypothetical protein